LCGIGAVIGRPRRNLGQVVGIQSPLTLICQKTQ
jgi:hypothetical protein